jgi:hypothetical protein
MATANLPPTYFTYFTYVDALGYVKPAVGYKLYQYVSGTTTNQDTYTSQAGTTANSHPITLDANGACNLWLDPSLEYTFVLKTAAGSTVWTRDDVFASPNAASVVSSVNTETGAVTLDAFDIGYDTNSPQSWFAGATVGAALDDIITQVNAEPAANVTIADAGGYYTGTTAEAALQEVGVSMAVGGRLIGVQVFTASGTYTKTAGTTSCVVQLVGGGGGSCAVGSGGGGGGGGYSCKRVTSIGATETVTIGAGGTVNGTGGTTSFGSHCSATGGSPGGGTAGGAGGAGSSGDYNLTGSAGGYGGSWSANTYHGHGGASFFGGGAAGDLNRGAGVNSAANSGGGGSGGTASGGTGGSGLVVIHEYK